MDGIQPGQEPHAEVTFAPNASTPVASSLLVSPGTSSANGWVTPSLTPLLSAVVTDPDNRKVGAQVEIQHDPAVPAQGSGLIWSTDTGSSSASGSLISVDVPTRKLFDGWSVQWRIRPSASGTYGVWSAWQSLRVDRSKPSVSSLLPSPARLDAKTWVTSSLRPLLTAVVKDPDNRNVGVNLEVRHDPGVPSQGTGLIYSESTAATSPSGSRISILMPDGKLSNGWSVQWRVQGWAASTDSVAGPWSEWQSLKVAPVTVDWVSPVDNSQVNSLTPTLSASATPGDESADVTYWFQVCEGTPGNWTWCESSNNWGLSNGWDVPAGKLKWGRTYWWQVQAAASGVKEISPWRTFTVTPGQGTINALLASGTDGREFNHVTGNYTQTATDASVATVGAPLSITRTYNSLDPRSDAPFGAGWTTQWDTRIQDEPQTKTVLVTYPNGRQYRFAAKADGSYAAPLGVLAKLATVAGGGWRLMDQTSTSFWFDAQGRLTKISDARNRAQQLTYGTDGKLAKITTTAGGRSLTLVWTGNHVTGVSTDPVDGKALTWTYSYDGDTLTAVCPPTAGTECTTYAYTGNSRYRTVAVDTRPTGYWRLGDTQVALGSKIADSAEWDVDPNEAVLDGGTFDATVGIAGALAGTSDKAMRFKGTSNSTYVQLPHAAISRNGGFLSLEAWFKTTASGTVIGYDTLSGGAAIPAIYVGKDGKLRGQFNTGTASPITSATIVNDDKWHHVVLSGAENTQTLYLDGQTVGTLDGTITNLDRSDAQIGYGYASASWPSTVTTSSAFPFAGDIDEVAVYGKPLGLAEVRTHFAARLAQPQLTKVTLPSGRVWSINTYDADGGRLLTHTDNNGGTWKLGSLQYNGDVVAEDGIAVTTAVTDPRNGTLTYVNEGDRDYRPISVTDQLGKVIKHEYDSSGFLAKITDRNGNVFRLYNDERGNRSVANPAARRMTVSGPMRRTT
ncbi:LamG-like jellyroll fold domain-containing protein [Nonomuraea aurantiaca]|uniref:LamG-like jellyroll fold domain-containing protein n=1 Tax=Nonomuraea aurantiaca TaxID=2878562 RepID=UPI001CD9D7CF|nr:LamG-like jellyroll fold domain-containing protein [Nonomuraea aurantiaca]MCA2220563.1 DUF6531 domain-containing protein [Nonomuraea aurantiaca]